jgi:UDP-N-acetylglucosamine:LPS N-acetylglucosamine transferase
MPQESQTANLLSRYKAGLLLERAADIVPIVRRLIHDPAEMASMRAAASRLAIPDATKRIVGELMRKTEERVAPLKQVVEPGDPVHSAITT